MITIRDSAQTSIDGATGSEQCVQNAVTVWETALDAAGVSIAACSEQITTPITNATEDFHHYHQEQNALAFEVQNIILNVFTEVCWIDVLFVTLN